MTTGMEHWLPIWRGKASQDPAAAAGRSNYGPAHVKALVTDAVAGLGLHAGDTLLDVGCAQGLMGEHLREGLSRYVGVDAVYGMVAAFRQRCRVEAYVASATDLSCFSDGEFSKALLSSVLLVLSREEGLQALRELRRVTAAGGRGFISGNVHTATDKTPFGKECDPGCLCYAHVTAWPIQDLCAAAAAAGWRNPRVRPINPALQQATYQWDLAVEA